MTSKPEQSAKHWIGVISIFPEMFKALTDFGVTSRAIKNGLVDVKLWDLRDFTHDKHRSVDDRPFGGGPGMLMKMQPLEEAIGVARQHAEQQFGVSKVLYLSPQGKPLKQQQVEALVKQPGLILLAGRYEGIDERLIAEKVDEECSIGDYVLSGGELPAMVLMDAIIRLLPGALGHSLSAFEDSFTDGLLDHPHYTRPEVYKKSKVPDVLLSGHHENIKNWRLKQALGRTWIRRPDLLEKRVLSIHEQQLLQEFISEYENTQRKK